MTTMLKMFGTGQVTLPKEWRKKFKTTQFLARMEGRRLIIEPVELDDAETGLLTHNPSLAFLKEEPDLYE